MFHFINMGVWNNSQDWTCCTNTYVLISLANIKIYCESFFFLLRGDPNFGWLCGSTCPQIYKSNKAYNTKQYNYIVSVLTSSAVDDGLSSDPVKPKTIKLLLAASTLSTKHYEVRPKTWSAQNQDNCVSGVRCLPADCFS